MECQDKAGHTCILRRHPTHIIMEECKGSYTVWLSLAIRGWRANLVPPSYAFPGGQPGQMMPTVAPVAGNYTRNLIGSCSVSAAQLADTEDRLGFWFVLQDLSVRTEGSFR